jgi:hypothetical protein
VTEYKLTELKILWYLKRHGPLTRTTGRGIQGLMTRLSNELEVGVGAIRYALTSLENQSLVLRTYQRPVSHKFGEDRNNLLMRIELVDPRMFLPPLPVMPLAVVIAHENVELQERVAQKREEAGTGPTAEQIVDALIDRVFELQAQIDKMHGVVTQLTVENETLKKQSERQVGHLTTRLKDALRPDQWETLRGR